MLVYTRPDATVIEAWSSISITRSRRLFESMQRRWAAVLKNEGLHKKTLKYIRQNFDVSNKISPIVSYSFR